MSPFLRSLPKGAMLLDAGCGLGNWTVHFAKNGYSVLGMDIARETIEKLQELFPDIEFAVGDIRNTGLDSETFDCIFSWGVFEHFEEGMQPCIQEAYRLLKPGGFLFVSVPYDNFRHTLRSIRYRRQSGFASEKIQFYQWRLTRQEMLTELTRGGFDVIGIKQIGKRQGLLRCLYHEFRLHYDWLLTKGLSVILQPFFPAWLVSHMILGIAWKHREES